MNKIFITFCVIIMCSCTKKLDFWESSYGKGNIRIKRLNNCEGEIYRINKSDDVLNFTNYPTGSVSFDYYKNNKLINLLSFNISLLYQKLHTNSYHIDTINWCHSRLGEGKYQFYFSDENWKEKVGPIDFENKLSDFINLQLELDSIKYSDKKKLNIYFTNRSDQKVSTVDLNYEFRYEDPIVYVSDNISYRMYSFIIEESLYYPKFNKKIIEIGEQGIFTIDIPVKYINSIDLKKCPRLTIRIDTPNYVDLEVILDNNILGIGDCKK